MKYTYEDLTKRLQNHLMTITFTKVDGTERVMKCTLLAHFLPEEYRNKVPLPLVEGDPVPATISVWDIEAAGWRSFRIENVTKAVENYGRA
jgi:hypothetical protein